ncbi:hypothetical protein [Synechococcus elongatus]|uniref:Calcium-binding protein n=1 Tax=Synechococcus elongatus (strain ATCC 33912 / PCC 7942 / FACHB-805) TaxID=1140 RepID=Q31Q51_SYNE7|nr:hypothetical protein [Synechococcus elongatus]ABB56818.1 conserved hypothetical protein [Synechococcus elongatus PCC 7942 = FACHB-805]AJD58653.1 hypothetical protein M744_12820 [Synechococcus elongatus UTEX 2973]MBD2588688.1 hypothetical protein [Synechococcus elongatus FACHB-242]MBD2689724.1 hypothetical protein [Synechococcus elongatus FACHB-1061]MBD2708330.1 hypothetical protein [Synechococcus elongatus PCC 7942 = FACHB-805]
MKLLFVVPHYWKPTGGNYGSLGADPSPRVTALSSLITALHSQFGPQQALLQIRDRTLQPANQQKAVQVEIAIFTTQDCHVLEHLALPKTLYQHHPVDCEPMFLGFAAQAYLRDRQHDFDWYGFLEDDLIIEDPLFFLKQQWFQANVGSQAVLQPNRFDSLLTDNKPHKLYIDGPNSGIAVQFWPDREAMQLTGKFLGFPITFERSVNPHSGCFFLSQAQVQMLVAHPCFLDRDTRFVGPLESAASLSLMKVFRVYKPAALQAAFLEIRHHPANFLKNLRFSAGTVAAK